MLVGLNVRNWMSFRDITKFSMLASKEKQHGDRVPSIASLKTRILPISVIYGGNASGKTNLFKALVFMRRFIVEGSKPDELIPVEPFRLEHEGVNVPSSFTVELLIEDRIHEYRFAVTGMRVVEESLIIKSRTSEEMVFERTLDVMKWGKDYNEDEFLKFAFRGTRENQLFLTNAVSQKVVSLAFVYMWFRNSLILIRPGASYNGIHRFIDPESPMCVPMRDALRELDTGIHSIGGEEVEFDSLGLDDTELNNISQTLSNGRNYTYRRKNGGRVILSRKEGEFMAQKIVTKHRAADGREVRFDLSDESDGTQRAIDLLPALFDLMSNNHTKTYIIDEVDRSLHHLLTLTLIKSFLSSCTKDSRNQLIMTTHDILLMDQKLFRRDEMWITERKSNGSSSIVSFSDFRDVRYDKDIRKSYLQGRLGGVPQILVPALTQHKLATKKP